MKNERNKLEEQVWTNCLLAIAKARNQQGVGLVKAGYPENFASNHQTKVRLEVKEEVKMQLMPVMIAAIRSSDEETRAQPKR